MVRINNDLGTIKISNDVFVALTSEAAVNCFGVKGMTVRGVKDGLVHLLNREAQGKGVHITYNEDGTVSIELHIAVDQGVNIPAICDSIVKQVRWQVGGATSVEIRDVEIFVDTIIIG